MLGPKMALFVVLVVFAALVVVAYGPILPRWVVSTVLIAPSEGMSEVFGQRMVGVVQGGGFVPLDLEHGGLAAVQLTGIPMQAAQAPESGLVDLSAYEGQAIAIWGRNSGGWVYSAQVEGPLDPITSLVVRWGF